MRHNNDSLYAALIVIVIGLMIGLCSVLAVVTAENVHAKPYECNPTNSETCLGN